MLKVNANLFRLAYVCASSEETRYYLKGVYVEPVAEGVLLVATDGHRLVCIHDKTGYADKPAIVQLSKGALKACKSPKNGLGRILKVEDNTATVVTFDLNEEGTPVAIHSNSIVDGTFPDWRRVIPTQESLDTTENGKLYGYNAKYIASFGDIGDGLQNYGQSMLLFTQNNQGGPSLVRWAGIDNAFGVLMPMRVGEEANLVPDFYRHVEPAMLQAAE